MAEKTARRKEVERTFPDLSFYYGFTYTQLARTPTTILRIYINKLPKLVASQQLRAIEASTFAHMDEPTRSSIIRRLERIVNDDDTEMVKTPKTVDEAALLASKAGIAFKVLDKDGNEAN